MSYWDDVIYSSEEYKARIERARKSLTALSYHEALNTAAESIAYWQMRTVKAEETLLREGHLEFAPDKLSPRTE